MNLTYIFLYARFTLAWPPRHRIMFSFQISRVSPFLFSPLYVWKLEHVFQVDLAPCMP